MVHIKKAAIEVARQAWAETAKNHGWYKEPFYITVWVDDKGKIWNTLCTTLMLSEAKGDIIKAEEDDHIISNDKYELI